MISVISRISGISGISVDWSGVAGIRSSIFSRPLYCSSSIQSILSLDSTLPLVSLLSPLCLSPLLPRDSSESNNSSLSEMPLYHGYSSLTLYSLIINIHYIHVFAIDSCKSRNHSSILYYIYIYYYLYSYILINQ